MYSDYYSYDIETFKNYFSCVVIRHSDKAQWKFEISPWVHEGFEFYIFVQQIASSGGVMVGYNNWFFDYPVIHKLMDRQGQVNADFMYRAGQEIINDPNHSPTAKWNHAIWDRDQYCPQIDLLRVHHFDNRAKMTSLKLLEFNMRMDDIQELPYSPHVDMNQQQAGHVLSYNAHDVKATDKLLDFTIPMLEMRYELSEKFGVNMVNFNDTKMGEQIVVETLKKSGVHLKKGMKTLRSEIHVKDILFDYIHFDTPEFNGVLDFFRELVIDTTNMKGCIPDLSCTLNGFQFDFGVGGIHGSVSNTVVKSTKEKKLRDSDVK